jgi:starch phosphorylase
MKAALNGALNCSILDGWWDECFDGSNGWAINSADDDPDLNRRDAREATSLFGLLEREIVPLFYERTDGVPMGWVETMRQNWRSLGPYVTAARMVRNYATDLYEPAAASSRAALADDATVARDLAAWKQRVRRAWPAVKLVSLDGDTSPAHEGEVRHVIAHVDIDGLEPESITVQALHGPIDSEGEFLGLPKIVSLARTADGVWEADYTVGEAGPYGITVRAMPSHPQLISPVEMGIIAWAN